MASRIVKHPPCMLYKTIPMCFHSDHRRSTGMAFPLLNIIVKNQYNYTKAIMPNQLMNSIVNARE